MPWRGPVEDGEFPTLGYAVADWIEDNCAIPDGDLTGQPFILTDEQIKFLLRFYRIDPDVSPGDHPTSVFKYRRAQLVRPQKWGKGPLSAAIVCAEAAGPVLFDGWDANGEPVGRPWATPWIQLVAVSEDQTDNVMNALIPMIELGALKAEIPDVGRTRINVVADGGFGRIEPVTSAAISRLGQRLTFAVHDETHSWNSHNGGVKLADTQRRNLAGMGGRSIETTNAWNPAEQSVAQMTYESELDDVLIDFPETPKASIRNKAQRRKALKTAYGDSWWIDLDRIESEIEELLPRDPNQAERFFLNRIVSASDRAFDIDQWNRLAAPQDIEPGRLITLGFDGARREDSTALVATDVERGYQWVIGIWEKPKDDADPDWEVSEPEIQEAVAYAFETWDVWRLYADPPYFESQIDAWAGTYGEQRVIRWWTNRQKAMAYAIRAWTTDWREGVLTHDGNETLMNHIGNSVRHRTRMRDDAGGWLWTIRKDAAKSPRKIDGAMAACLSWEARGDAIADGVLNRQTYTTASW